MTIVPARAVLVFGGETGSEITEAQIDKEIALVGRSSLLDNVFPDVDLSLVDPQNYVSRRHAFILRRRGGYAVEDLESVNGTYLNDSRRRLAPHVNAELADGDEIVFGQTRCTFKTVKAPVLR